jgi:cytochrome c
MRSLGSFSITTATLTFVLLLAGCQGGKTARVYAVYTGGNPDRGAQLIRQYRCGSCHMIPGIRNASGLVGPPLILFGRRTYIAGEVPNNPDNLIRWLKSPPSIEPGTAMPVLGLSDDQARDIAAYLYTLR